MTQRHPQGRVVSTFEEEDDETFEPCDDVTLDERRAEHGAIMRDAYAD